jgi:hypothetical protein
MKNNKLLNKILLGFAGLFLLVFGLVAGAILVRQDQNLNEDAAPASSVYLSPNSQQVGQNNNFNFNVKINTAENLMSGVDLRIKFDKNIFEIVSLEKGENISDFNNILASDTGNSTGEIKYIAFTLDKSKAIHGNNLDLLKVNAKVKGDAPKAMYTLGFGDQTAASGLTESENIITGMDSAFITVTDHTDTDSTYVEGEPNNCGGTCGSNNNCKANLYCYQGFCRNPVCNTKTDCNCSTTTTTAPTTKPVVTPKSGITTKKTATPKSTVKGSPKATPNYTGGMTLIDKPTDLTRDDSDTQTEENAPENMFLTRYAMFIVGGFIVFAIIAIIYAIKQKRNTTIPHITPPTNI